MSDVMNVQTTASAGVSPAMQTYYDKNIIKNAKPHCIYAKYGQKKPIPKNKGQQVEFHKVNPFPKVLKPLTEGVTPKGNEITMTKVYAKPHQYGDYVTLSDVLETTAVDNLVLEVQENQGNQSGETLDYLTGLSLCCGTNVQYAGGVASRNLISAEHVLTAKDLLKARTTLVKNKAARFERDGFIAIAHPDVCQNIMQDPDWVTLNQHSKDGRNIYEGKIGGMYGVTLEEDPNAIVFEAEKLTAEADSLTVKSIENNMITVEEAISADEAANITGKNVAINGIVYFAVSVKNGGAGAAVIELNTVPVAVDPGDVVSGFGGGLNGVAVYPTLIFGKNAYGVTDIEGLGLQSIIKQKGSGGSADPLDQRSTIGWKATHTAVILTEEFMVRVESAARLD